MWELGDGADAQICASPQARCCLPPSYPHPILHPVGKKKTKNNQPAHFSNTWTHKNQCKKIFTKGTFFIKLILPKDQAGKRAGAHSQHVMDSVCENTRCIEIDTSAEKFPIATQEGPCLNTLQGNTLYLETIPWQKPYTNI